jgi:DNA polymerase-3 subunit chi
MTRIDFYVIKNNKPNSREVLACRIAEKAYKKGHKVYIHTASKDQLERMDDLLWTFRDGSFVPHDSHASPKAKQTPVLLGLDSDPVENTEILINLAQDVPGFFSRFDRVAEVVDDNSEDKQSARERFRFYRDRGYEMETHNL